MFFVKIQSMCFDYCFVRNYYFFAEFILKYYISCLAAIAVKILLCRCLAQKIVTKSGSKVVLKNYCCASKKHSPFDQCFCIQLLVENNIFLFQNSNKRGSLGQFFQFGSAYIRAGAPDATKNVF